MNEKTKQTGLDSFLNFIKSRKKSKISKSDQEIISLYDDGLSYQKIAERLGLNYQTVRNILVKHNVEMRSRSYYFKKTHDKIIKLHKKGFDTKKIAKKTYFAESTVEKVLIQAGCILSKRDERILKIAKYVELSNAGFRGEKLAEELNMTQRNLNRLILNSAIRVSLVDSRGFTNQLSNIVHDALKGMKVHELSDKYRVDLDKLKKVLQEFGLYKKEKLIEFTFSDDGFDINKKEVNSKKVDDCISIQETNSRLSPRSIIIYDFIKENDFVTQKEIIKNVKNISSRTVRSVLKTLQNKKLIAKKANIEDMRSAVYFIPEE